MTLVVPWSQVVEQNQAVLPAASSSFVPCGSRDQLSQQSFFMTTKSPGGAPYRHSTSASKTWDSEKARNVTHGRVRSMNPCFDTIQTSGDTQGFGELEP